jgi:cytochrome c biogenesis protein CcmG/thiol:disulfide interchange protein DsbE
MTSEPTDAVTTSASGHIEQRSRPRWGRVFAWVGVFGLLVLLFLGLLRTQQGPVKEGEPAPDFTLTTFNGQQYQLSDMHGKVVVLNFWASWCKPCEQEAADLEAAWRAYQPSGDVVFLGVAWTDTERKSLDYLDRFGITYPNGPDLGTRISQAYRTTGVPETYIIDKNGNLASFKLSPYLSVEEIRQAIDPLLRQ